MNRLRELLGWIVLSKHESLALIAVFSLYAVGLTWTYVQSNALPPPSEFLAQVDSVSGPSALRPTSFAVARPDTIPKKKVVDDSLATEPMETGRLNVNLATERQLTLLPGIGPALAGRIIQYREQNGPFTGPDQLLQVKGIGRKTLTRFEGMIVFD